jgi:hypothetical protein
MNWRAIAPLLQGLAAKKIRLAAKNAIADHQGDPNGDTRIFRESRR